LLDLFSQPQLIAPERLGKQAFINCSVRSSLGRLWWFFVLLWFPNLIKHKVVVFVSFVLILFVIIDDLFQEEHQ
jgi:hypothetical protein